MPHKINFKISQWHNTKTGTFKKLKVAIAHSLSTQQIWRIS